MRYPFVLFDAGETLFGPRESFGATYARVLAPLGIEAPGDAFERALRRTWAALSRVVPPGTDRYRFFEGGEEAFWLRVARGTIEGASGVEIVDSLARETLQRLRAAFLRVDAWTVYPDVVPCLEQLRERGARMGIVSNWDSRLPSVLGMLELDRFFDTVVISHHEGIEKPDPELFLRALARLGATPAASLHVGDVVELDLVGAAAAGIDGILVDRKGRARATECALPDFSALPRIVEGGFDGRSGSRGRS